MALMTFTANQIIHSSDQNCKTLEIILKGKVNLCSGAEEITLSAGSVIGFAETPASPYRYTYRAAEDCSIYSYPYTGIDDVEKLISVNQKIAPMITTSAVSDAAELYQMFLAIKNQAVSSYKKIKNDQKEYHMLCAEAGEQQQAFPELDSLPELPHSQQTPDWQKNFYASISKYDDRLHNNIYMIGPEVCTGFAYGAYDFMSNTGSDIRTYQSYLDNLNKVTSRFEMTVSALKARKKAIENDDGGAYMPDMEHVLDRILLYGNVDDELSSDIRKNIDEYKHFKDRGAVTDDLRAVRRKIAKDFYPVYEHVFLQSLEDPQIPPEIMMFLMFGYIDETIVTEDQTRKLYGFAQAYQPDPEGKILTIYEWLKKIYFMEVDPSRNEFDLDFPAYLRDCRNNGDITEEQEQDMLDDPESRLEFEITNLFTLGNRMTFGRISAFNPIFDDANVMVPLNTGYVSCERIKEEFDNIRQLDCQCFYRTRTYSDPDNGITSLVYHEEVKPYIILMPNVGNRCVLWQEIEGKKHATPARMLLPIFDTADLTTGIIKLCGEFRWEMCKTEQGMHWNDITDPSLTSEYSDYLQYFRKNSMLTGDYKERVKKQLQKAGNNFRVVFVNDYLEYMKYESRGSLRLNKVSREILFKYCPFGKEIRDSLGGNPQYEQYIQKFNNHAMQGVRPYVITIKKFQRDDIPVPDEIMNEVKYFKL